MACRNGLGNRLFFFAHCVALGEATGHRVFSSNLPEYGRYFNGRHGAFCVWPNSSLWRIPWPNWTRRAFNFVFRGALYLWEKYNLPGVKIIWATMDETEKISVENPEFLQMLRSHRLVVMTGWPAIEKIVVPNPETIHSFFTPKKEITIQCREIALKARGDADILIGMHFRWGDYLYHYEGAFYYSPEVYAQVMKRCVELFPGRRVAFLAISNEPQSLALSQELSGNMRMTLGPHTLMGDLHSLAECDYIVSPASTFSLWAAFYGRKPCWCMKDAHTLPELRDFVISENTFVGMHAESSHWVAHTEHSHETSQNSGSPAVTHNLAG